MTDESQNKTTFFHFSFYTILFLGGVVAYVLGDGKFKPVSKVIMYEMRDEDRHQLAVAVRNIVADLDAADAVQLLVMINGNAALKGRIITEISNFLRTQLSYAVM